jgi:mRNA interferase MazF
MQIEQGHCYLVDINPPRRSKPGKIRPVVVIQSSDTLKAGSPGVVVIPLTSKLRDENALRVRIRPSTHLKLAKPSDALLDQVHTIDRSLFIEELGPVTLQDFARIEDGVGFLLGF